MKKWKKCKVQETDRNQRNRRNRKMRQIFKNEQRVACEKFIGGFLTKYNFLANDGGLLKSDFCTGFLGQNWVKVHISDLSHFSLFSEKSHEWSFCQKPKKSAQNYSHSHFHRSQLRLEKWRKNPNLRLARYLGPNHKWWKYSHADLETKKLALWGKELTFCL